MQRLRLRFFMLSLVVAGCFVPISEARDPDGETHWFYSTDPYPPFVDGEDLAEVRGILVPYISHVLCPQNDCGVRSQIRPWKRVLKDLEYGEIDFTGPMFADPKKDYLIYTEPLFSGKLKIYFKRGRTDILNTDDPMKVIRSGRFNAGIVLGYSYTPEVDQVIESKPNKFSQYKSTELALKGLADGRIDYFIGLDLVTNHYIKALNLEDENFTTSNEDISLAVYVLGISKKSKLASEIKSINERIRSISFRDFIRN